MHNFDEIYKAIGAVSKKINSYNKSLNFYFNVRADANEQAAADAQNGLIDLDESRLQAEADAENALIELDTEINDRLSDIENALCELTTE